MMDHEKIKEGVRLMLEGIGEDVNREGLLETPDRIARMCEQIYGGLYEDAGVHLSNNFTLPITISFWKKISPFIPPANIICYHSMEKLMWLISRISAWQV